MTPAAAMQAAHGVIRTPGCVYVGRVEGRPVWRTVFRPLSVWERVALAMPSWVAWMGGAS